jgi:hypothetical protein
MVFMTMEHGQYADNEMNRGGTIYTYCRDELFEREKFQSTARGADVYRGNGLLTDGFAAQGIEVSACKTMSLQYECVEGRAESSGLQSGEEACYVGPTDNKGTGRFEP